MISNYKKRKNHIKISTSLLFIKDSLKVEGLIPLVWSEFIGVQVTPLVVGLIKYKLRISKYIPPHPASPRNWVRVKDMFNEGQEKVVWEYHLLSFHSVSNCSQNILNIGVNSDSVLYDSELCIFQNCVMRLWKRESSL